MPHWPRRDALDAPQPSRPLQLTPVVSQSPLAHSRDFALSHSLPGSSSTLMALMTLHAPQAPQGRSRLPKSVPLGPIGCPIGCYEGWMGSLSCDCRPSVMCSHPESHTPSSDCRPFSHSLHSHHSLHSLSPSSRLITLTDEDEECQPRRGALRE